jgi:REP element-mobilizing transposase RayT
MEGMSLPRPAHAGTTYMITRRCSERRFFLQPTPLVSQVYGYLLAVAGARTGVLLHAVCVQGNHTHVIATDPDKRIPAFYEYLHGLVARHLNASRGRWEAMWASEETTRVRLEDVGAVIDETVYTLCNPVSSHLVERASDWPGLRMWWADEPVVIERPEGFFSDDTSLPDEVTLRFVPPLALAGLDGDDGVGRLRRALDEREDQIRRKAFVLKRSFLGLRALADQHWSESPESFARRRGLRPRVATKNKWRRIAAIQRDRAFVATYAACRERWLAGDRDIEWPPGTYKMRVVHRAACAQAPPG